MKVLNKRIYIVAFLNFIFSLYYFYLLVGVFRIKSEFQIPIYILSGGGLVISGILMLFGRRIGKKITKIVGLFGIFVVIGISIWTLTFLFDSRYNPTSIVEDFIVNLIVYLARHAYPIIAGFVILNKPDEDLGLQ